MSEQLDNRLKMPSGREIVSNHINSLEFVNLGAEEVRLKISTDKRTCILVFFSKKLAEDAALDIAQMLEDVNS